MVSGRLNKIFLSTDGSRRAAFSAGVLRRDTGGMPSCCTDEVRSSRQRWTDDGRCNNGRGAYSRQ